MTILGDHRCDAPGCGERGPFGFAVGKGRPLVWYCGQHRTIGEGRLAPASAVPESDGRPVTVVGQGSLF